MRLEVLADAGAAAQRAASCIAVGLREALQERPRCALALSGGETASALLIALARESLPWERVELFQVDERVAPRGSAARNLTQLERLLVRPARLATEHLHAMPVEAIDIAAAAADYAATLTAVAGMPPVLDVVHLGLGTDGHTASLVPGDAVLEVDDRWVAEVGEYRGHRRMTLTFATLARARRIVWLVCGASKAAAMQGLISGNSCMPAGRVARACATIVADEAAASGVAWGLRS